MASGAGNTTPLGTWPVDLSGLPRTADRDFLTGMCDVVALQWDTGYLGGDVGPMGDPVVSPDDRWSAVEGFEAILCRITLKQFVLTQGAGRPGQTADGRVQFGQAIPADRRNRLVYQDPVFGLRYFYLTGPVEPKKELQTPHHWFAFFTTAPN